MNKYIKMDILKLLNSELENAYKNPNIKFEMIGEKMKYLSLLIQVVEKYDEIQPIIKREIENIAKKEYSIYPF